MKNEEFKKISASKVNQLLSIGNKILKILYVLFVILLLYVLTLIFREWNIFTILGKILSIISPLFIGWFIAWLLKPMVNKLCDKGVKRGLSVTFAYLVMLIIIGLALGFTIPALSNQIGEVVSSIPDISNDISRWINNIFTKLSNMTLYNTDNIKDTFMLKIQNYANNLQTNLPDIAVSLVSGAASGVGKILLSLILGFYILYDFDKVSTTFIHFFPKKARTEVRYLLNKLNDTLYSFISGTLWLSLLLFVVSVIGFSIIGLSAPVLIAFICVITNLIPYVGPYIGAAAAAVIGFAESSVIGILTLIFILIVQLLEGEILHPLVMSKKMNLSPITIIISLLVFEYMFGIFGMVIATPVVALLKIIYVFLDEKFDFFGFIDKKEE